MENRPLTASFKRTTSNTITTSKSNSTVTLVVMVLTLLFALLYASGWWDFFSLFESDTNDWMKEAARSDPAASFGSPSDFSSSSPPSVASREVSSHHSIPSPPPPSPSPSSPHSPSLPFPFHQHSFRPTGLFSFVHFSSYRLSASRFAVIGLGARALDDVRSVHNCSWVAGDPGMGGGNTGRGRRLRGMGRRVTEGEMRRWEQRSRGLRQGVYDSKVGSEQNGLKGVMGVGGRRKDRRLEEGVGGGGEGGQSSSQEGSGSSDNNNKEGDGSSDSDNKEGGGSSDSDNKEGGGSSDSDNKEGGDSKVGKGSEGNGGSEKKEGGQEEKGKKAEEQKAEEERKDVGKVEQIHVGEHHYWKYAVLILVCTLNGDAPLSPGGQLKMFIDEQEEVVYEEMPGQLNEASPRSPFVHNITFCSPPIHSKVHEDRIMHWLQLHLERGIDHYIFYDAGGVNEKLRGMLRPYTEAGIVEITPFETVHRFESWYHGQVLIVNECMYRARQTSLWVTYLDFDEFLWYKGDTADRLVNAVDYLLPFIGKTFVSHGCQWWDTFRCLPALEGGGQKDPRWPLERMLWHWPQPYCQNKEQHEDIQRCLGSDGHRKLFVDPRRARAVTNHDVAEPQEDGLDLSFGEMRHNHFHGLIGSTVAECNDTHEEKEELVWWTMDTTMAARARKARGSQVDISALIARQQVWNEHVHRRHETSQ